MSRKSGKNVHCCNCNKEFYLPKNRLDRYDYYCCSPKCHGEYKTQKCIEEYQQKLNIDNLSEWMYQKYVIEQKTIRQLEKIIGVGSNRTILKWLNKFHIPIRHGSDAIKTQWLGNEERRKKTGQTFGKSNKGKPAWNHGLTVKSGDKLAIWLSETRKGSGNPMFRHDLSDEERIMSKRRRMVIGYDYWRRSVYRRDNYTCKACGDSKGGNLVAHHLDSYAANKELRTQINNGITLCNDCHKEFHRHYGNKNNTAEQFSEFYLFKTGKRYSTIYQLALF